MSSTSRRREFTWTQSLCYRADTCIAWENMDISWWENPTLWKAVALASLVVGLLSWFGVEPMTAATWVVGAFLWIIIAVSAYWSIKWWPNGTFVVSVLLMGGAIFYGHVLRTPSQELKPPPHFISTLSELYMGADGRYYMEFSVRNVGGIARNLMTQLVVTYQYLGSGSDTIFNDSVDPYPYASTQDPQQEITFFGTTSLDKREVDQPLFVALLLRYTNVRTSQTCTQSIYYAYPGLEPADDFPNRLLRTEDEQQARIETYLTKQDLSPFPLPAKGCPT